MASHNHLAHDYADGDPDSLDVDRPGEDVVPSSEWPLAYTDLFHYMLSLLDDDEKWASEAASVERSPQGIYNYIEGHLNRYSRGIDRLLEDHYAAIEEGRISPDPRLDGIDPPGERRGFKYYYINREGDNSIEEGAEGRRRGLNGIFELPDGRIVTVTSASNGTASVGPKNVDIGYPDGRILASVPKPVDDSFTTGFRSFVGVKTDLGVVRWDSESASVFNIEGVIKVNSIDFMIRESSDGVQIWRMPPRTHQEIVDQEFGGNGAWAALAMSARRPNHS